MKPFVKPLLSILTPVYNSELWLAECVKSAQAQSFDDWEWIFVNDHSTDSTKEMLAGLATKDARIKVFDNPAKGIISALQKALDESQGTYITRMDADDLMPAGRLQILAEALRNAPPKTVVTGKVKYFASTEISKGYLEYENWLNRIATANEFWKNLYRECVVASPNWMMLRKELLEIGGFQNLEYPEDYDLVFRWYQNGFKIKAVTDTTLLWREHERRTSRNSEHYSQPYFFKLKIKRFVESEYQKLPLVLWGTGTKARLVAKTLDEQGIPFTWMDLNPTKFPNGIYQHEIRDYQEIEKLGACKLLVAIYPPPSALTKLKNYLNQLTLTEGEDYWFL